MEQLLRTVPLDSARLAAQNKSTGRHDMMKSVYLTDFQTFGNGLPFESLLPI
jgi:hypothetical protein